MTALAGWLIEVHLAAAVLLGGALLAWPWVRQPVRRLALARAVLLGWVVCAALLALPNDRAHDPRPAPPPSAPAPAVQFWDQLGDHLEQVPTLVPTAGPPPTPVVATPSWSWADGAVLLYLTGAAAVLTWLTVGAWRTARLVRQAGDAPAEWRDLLRRIAGGREPALRLCPGLGQPAAIGLLRPVVLLPAAATDVGPAQLEAVLAHEWAHIRRGDLWLLALSRLLLVPLYVQPLYWWLRARVRLEQELLADATAAAADPITYAQELVAWARRGSRAPAAVLAMSGKPSQLTVRVGRLLQPDRQPEDLTCPLGWRLATLGTVGLAVLGLSRPTLRPAAPAVAAVAQVSRPRASAGAAAPVLRYRWQPGRRHVYAVRLEAVSDAGQEVVTGHAVYQVGPAGADGVTLTHVARLQTQWQPAQEPSGDAARLLTAYHGDVPTGQALRVDGLGNLAAPAGETWQGILGPLARLVIEPLAATPESSWEVNGTCTVAVADADEPSPGPQVVPLFARPAPPAPLPAREWRCYVVGTPAGALVPVHKQYDLRTLATAAGQPCLHLAGEGQLTFDTALGLPRRLNFRGTCARATPYVTRRASVTVTYQLVDER